ncbi:hypothetical protein [Crocosphaera chwakensis]|uniref:Uncharacterized protein n=1 Tax=Crocosphaera chwakensis CCY0110 TaxID=391612 RepID=A3ITW6_9CHRO|nr:hypothetical protein [Crocosphaera chwakensis]EAZ90061.1 hypothetical protein CY0110_14985 [Crocosphaera chwakensis CCY0110]
MKYFSLKMTILAYKKGLIENNPSDTFIFSCRRSRVFNNDGKYPGYSLLFENPTPETVYNPDRISLSDLSKEAAKKCVEFFELINLADQQGRVIWLTKEDGSPRFQDDLGDAISLVEIYNNTPPDERFPVHLLLGRTTSEIESLLDEEIKRKSDKQTLFSSIINCIIRNH